MDCFRPFSLPGRGLVPCGKCVACLLRRQQDWLVRLSCEARASTAVHFITLTYNDGCVPRGSFEASPFMVLRKMHVQSFLKRLRSYIEPNRIRYFAVGEYGSKSHRPHYHLILFNWPRGFDLWALVNKAWTYGFTDVKVCDDGHFAYVAKYVTYTMDLPKILKKKEYKPFSLSSRRPAIGSSYLSDAKVNYHRNTLNTTVRLEGFTYALPRYYKEKIFDDDMKESIRERVDDYRLSKLKNDGYFLSKETSVRALADSIKYREDYKFEVERRLKAKINKSSKI
ncbi:replication initiation protein [Tortoise microvirus 33]|nr:replication initiation protein [Tortoise microvirus 33]